MGAEAETTQGVYGEQGYRFSNRTGNLLEKARVDYTYDLRHEVFRSIVLQGKS